MKQNVQFKLIDNRFLIDTSELIGEGSIGKVYRAYDYYNHNAFLCCKMVEINKI